MCVIVVDSLLGVLRSALIGSVSVLVVVVRACVRACVRAAPLRACVLDANIDVPCVFVSMHKRECVRACNWC